MLPGSELLDISVVSKDAPVDRAALALRRGLGTSVALDTDVNAAALAEQAAHVLATFAAHTPRRPRKSRIAQYKARIELGGG